MSEVTRAAGSLDPPADLRTVRRIHVADRGCHYEIADGLGWEP